MPYSIEAGDVLEPVPSHVQLRLREALDEITSVIAALPQGSTFLSLFHDERLQLDLLGWRFLYEVDPESARVRVVSARAP